MERLEAVIVNKLGVHARPSAKITQLATRFQSEVWMAKGARRINAKSIMGVVMLAAAGPDEKEAVTALADLIAAGFGEEI